MIFDLTFPYDVIVLVAMITAAWLIGKPILTAVYEELSSWRPLPRPEESSTNSKQNHYNLDAADESVEPSMGLFGNSKQGSGNKKTQKAAPSVFGGEPVEAHLRRQIVIIEGKLKKSNECLIAKSAENSDLRRRVEFLEKALDGARSSSKSSEDTDKLKLKTKVSELQDANEALTAHNSVLKKTIDQLKVEHQKELDAKFKEHFDASSNAVTQVERRLNTQIESINGKLSQAQSDLKKKSDSLLELSGALESQKAEAAQVSSQYLNAAEIQKKLEAKVESLNGQLTQAKSEAVEKTESIRLLNAALESQKNAAAKVRNTEASEYALQITHLTKAVEASDSELKLKKQTLDALEQQLKVESGEAKKIRDGLELRNKELTETLSSQAADLAASEKKRNELEAAAKQVSAELTSAKIEIGKLQKQAVRASEFEQHINEQAQTIKDLKDQVKLLRQTKAPTAIELPNAVANDIVTEPNSEEMGTKGTEAEVSATVEGQEGKVHEDRAAAKLARKM